MFSQAFIDRIKACGLKQIAEQYTQLQQIAPDTWRGPCPHPDHEDSTPSFDIIKSANGYEFWKCWGCHCGKKDGVTNFGNDNIAFVQWMSHSSKSKKQLSFQEAVYLLADYYGIPREEENDPNIEKYKENMDLATVYHAAMPIEAKEYLCSRGLEQSDIDKWMLGYNVFTGRITFPICDKYHNILGFSNRILNANTDNAPKYINSPSSDIFNKKKILYGIQHYNGNTSSIIITEGQLDVILAHKFGLDNVVATLGCHLSEEHIEVLKAMKKKIILSYDGDAAGEKGITKALEDLHAAGISDVNVLLLPSGLDLADTALSYKNDLVQYAANHTMTHAQYRLDKIAFQFDQKVMMAQQELMPQINNILSSIIDENESLLAKNFINRRLKIWVA